MPPNNILNSGEISDTFREQSRCAMAESEKFWQSQQKIPNFGFRAYATAL